MLEEKPHLAIPSLAQKQAIEKAFVEDLKSFTAVNEETGELLPIICCVCDQVLDIPNLHDEVDIDEFMQLCAASNLEKGNLVPFYPTELVNQYMASPEKLEQYVLSPASIVLEGNHTMKVCKECHEQMNKNVRSKVRKYR